MKIHHLVQGSSEWKAHRKHYRNASDAPAVLSCSPYKTRKQLLHELATGIVPEVDDATQRRFDDGHRFEALARPLGEQIIGEELYPVVVSEGMYSASFDGLTIGEEVGYEHKSLNDDIRTALPSVGLNENVVLPKVYRVQMEQQCMVSGASRILFMASKWFDGKLVEERHCWYYPDTALRAELVAAWDQMAADIETYVVPPSSSLEKIVAEPVEALPAPVVTVSGQLTLQDNFKIFEERLRHFLEHRLIRAPKTDEDFVNLDAQIKAMKGAEVALDSAEAQMLAQIQTVDSAKKTKDMLATLVRDNRLMAEKLLTNEKERRRSEIVTSGITALREHCAALTQRIGKPYLPTIQADFAGAIKGMRSLSSMEDAIATTLASAKIEANAIADSIQINLSKLRELAPEHAFLFADTAQLVLKPADDCETTIRLRIAEHKEKEEKRLADLREEERIKAEAKAKADVEAAARQQAAASEPAPSLASAAAPTPAPRYAAAQPVIDTGTQIKMGDINARLGFIVTGEFLSKIGFQSIPTERPGKWYREADFPAICMAIIRHLEAAANAPAKAA